MSKESKLLKNTMIYAIGNFSTKILSFLIVPLYTHYINTADMGVYDLIVTTLTFLSPVITFQLTDGIYRWLLDPEYDKYIIIKTGIVRVFSNMALVLVIGAPILLFLKVSYGILILLMLILQSVFYILQQIARGLKNNYIYVISGIVHSSIFLGLNVLQIVIFNRGIRGLMESQIISCFFSSILLIALQPTIIKAFHVPFSNKTDHEMLKYSLPLIPNAISWSVVNMSDRYIIKYFLGNSANGIYSIAYKFPAVVQIFTNFFYLAWQESSIVEYKSVDRDSYYSNIFSKYFRFLFSLIIALMPITQLYVVCTMDSNYHTAWLYTGFLYLGTVFSALSSFLGTAYQISKRSVGALTTTILAATVNAGVNIIAIKFIGLQAAAFSTFFAYLVLFIVRVFDTKKYFELKVKWKEFWLVAVAALIHVIVYNCIDSIIIKIFLQVASIVFFFIYNKKMMIGLSRKIFRTIEGR